MRQSFSGRRPAPKTIYLTLAGIGSALVYGAFVLRIPLLRTYTAPLLNLNHIPAADWPAGLLVAGCAALLFGGYLVGALSVSTARAQRLTPLLVVGFPLIFIALLLLAHPMTSTDV
ncbi:MAG TPA: hypothetical protein VF897_09190, partial [Roseiflexaceae bacterium]